MKIAVFLGPTLPVREAQRLLQAMYLPPVAQGDVLRIMAQAPDAIAIVDGYFERVPAVWHKEILWAMSEGIPVFGASSMGALRAAELHEFGMVGVGTIFQQYLSGELDADDEVAVAHASADEGYRCVSEAMVNIRATLSRAESEGVISSGVRVALEQLAKVEFYPDRHYALLFENARRANLPERELAELRGWLPRGRVDQKRLDAVALLTTLPALIGPPGQSPRSRFRFERTDAWEVAKESASNLTALSDIASESRLLAHAGLNAPRASGQRT